MALPTSYSKQTNRYLIGDFGTIYNGKNNGGGNPYHDALGRFTTGPSTAFGRFAYDASKANDITERATTPDDLGFDFEETEKPNIYVAELGEFSQDELKRELRSKGIEGEDLDRAMSSKLTDLEDTIGRDAVEKYKKSDENKITVDTYLQPEHAKGLVDTTFTMEKIARDNKWEDKMDYDVYGGGVPNVIIGQLQTIARELRDYGKTVQMASQWGGASQQTADRITEQPKKELAEKIKIVDKMMSGLNRNPNYSDTAKKVVSEMYDATRAGYNTLKYIEDNINRDGAKYTVDVTDNLGIKRSRASAGRSYLGRA